jgi:hypothetical protein
VVVFAAPAALLLVAAGVLPVFTWLKARAPLAVLPVVVLLLVPLGQAAYRMLVPWTRLDAAAPSALVLRARQPDEPVVGIYWEHAYYFRDLGPRFRALYPQPTEPPTPAPTSGEGLPGGEARLRRLWVVGQKDAAAQEGYLRSLSADGRWRVLAKYEFTDSAVLYLERHP